MQNVLALVQAELWLVPRMAPRQVVRRFRSILVFDEAAPRGRLPDERFSPSVGRSSQCTTARATCIR